jgi:predicted esterase
MQHADPHGEQDVIFAGHDLGTAGSAFILLHGRGASARDILAVGQHLAGQQNALIAPEAASHSWYPYSFLAPLAQNQPWLDSALGKVGSCLDICVSAGIATDRIAIIGFSQGACLATEFVARNPTRYGAVIAFTGGLLGPLGTPLDHHGALKGTPILLTSGDPDPHVPWQRVEETGEVLGRMGAAVQLMRHPDRPHTILNSELHAAGDLLRSAGLSPGRETEEFTFR